MGFEDGVELVGKSLDVAGVSVIVGGILLATVVHARRFSWDAAHEQYPTYRRASGERFCSASRSSSAPTFIRAVAVDPTFESAGVLAIIVAIRTFLSFSLEVELEGRWQHRNARDGGTRAERHPHNP